MSIYVWIKRKWTIKMIVILFKSEKHRIKFFKHCVNNDTKKIKAMLKKGTAIKTTV